MITTRKRVHFGDGFHHCLSNFSAHRITLNRRKSPTSEHLYQESKFFNVKDAKMIRLEIREADSPFFAKEIAHENRIDTVLNGCWKSLKFKLCMRFFL
jgi:predicted NAD-dependent protein-ADP-ribosyltransferase YbiA (DUF1768 family)